MKKTAAQLKAVGKIIAASPTATELPRLENHLSLNDERNSLPSTGIITIPDPVDAIKSDGPAVMQFARGR